MSTINLKIGETGNESNVTKNALRSLSAAIPLGFVIVSSLLFVSTVSFEKLERMMGIKPILFLLGRKVPYH